MNHLPNNGGDSNDGGRSASRDKKALTIIRPGAISFPSVTSLASLSYRVGRVLCTQTIISLSALCLSAIFLGFGAFLLYKTHSDCIPINFFGASYLIVPVYAFGICNSAETQISNQISARGVMRWIFTSTNSAFVWSCFYIHGFADPDTLMWTYFLGGPVAIAVFAIVYGMYVNECKKVDIIENQENGRKGSARATIVLTTILTLVGFVYNAILSLMTLNEGEVWVSLFYLGLDIAICISVLGIFRKNINESLDRGVKIG